MQPFENVFIEDLQNCANDPVSSGIKIKVFYAPESFFHGIVIPNGDTFEAFATIADGNMEFKEGKAWSTFNCLVDENELKTMLAGPSLRKKMKSQLDIYLLGFTTKIIGFLAVVANIKMVFAVEDTNGNVWILGTKRNPAMIDKADGTTGKLYTDNSGFSASIIANTAVYRYAGNIKDFNTSGGDFNTDFNKDFFI